MATDRALAKLAQAGQLNSIVTADNAVAEVARQHTRSLCWTKSGNENSSNNVAEAIMFVANRTGVVKSIKLLTNSAVAASATGFVCTVSKRTGAGAAVPVGTYNTSSDAQGAIAAFVPASFSIVTSSDRNLAAADVLTFKCIKVGAGLLLDSPAAVVVDVEEV